VGHEGTRFKKAGRVESKVKNYFKQGEKGATGVLKARGLERSTGREIKPSWDNERRRVRKEISRI